MILVIGATGYVGRYFCNEMNCRKKEILALGRSKKVAEFFYKNGVPFSYFDVTDIKMFDNLPRNVDSIIYLSACLAEIETPVNNFFDVNTIGFFNVLEYARKNNIKKVVLASTHKVYNDINKKIIYFIRNHTLEGKGARLSYGITIHIGNADLV